jgi:lipase chaperone LimK
VAPGSLRLAAAGVLLAAALGAVWLISAGPRSVPAPTVDAEAVAGTPAASAERHLPRASAPERNDTPPPALSSLPPPSLIGSDPDGAIGLDEDGQLRIDLALRRWFDWQRAAIGELDQTTIRHRVEAGLLAALPPDQAAAGLELYDRYLVYLAASDRLPFDPDPLLMLDAERALRIDLLGARTAEAFFADEELALEARLLRRQLATDPDLAPAERDARLAALDAALPHELQPSIELQQVEQAEQLAELYQQAALTDAERLAERSELFGHDAAQRLAALDHERRGWQQRIDDYAALQVQLRRDPTLDAGGRRQALQRWMQDWLSPAEQRRLQALIDEGVIDGS